MKSTKLLIAIILITTILFFQGCSCEKGTTQDRAVAAGDHTICKKATHPDICILAVAKSTGKRSICDDISDTGWKNTCEASTQEEKEEDTKPLSEIVNGNEEHFTSCQDMVYAEINGAPPPGEGDVKKNIIYDQMVDKGYEEVKSGYVAAEEGSSSFINPQEGDIMLLGVNGAPDKKNAQHYAVYKNGKWNQILRFDEGGVYDTQTDISYFFKERTVTKPDGTKMTSPQIYQYYTIYRK